MRKHPAEEMDMSVKKKVNVLENIAKTVNCYLNDGTVKPEYTVKKIYARYPETVVCAMYSNAAKTYFAITPTNISISTDGVTFTPQIDYKDSAPFLVEDYSDEKVTVTVIAGDTAGITLYNTMKKEQLKYYLTCGVVHCGRLFGADELTLRWSGTGGFNDWSEGIGNSGYLLLDHAKGRVLNLLVYKGKLVAVRERGLTVFDMCGSPQNFSVNRTDADCDGITQHTACVVSDKLYFLSASGLKCFDGAKISPVAVGYTVVEANCAVGYAGRYFLACFVKELDRTVILCVDSASGKSFVIDASADTMFIKDGVRFFGPEGYMMLEQGGTYLVESGLIDFGNDKNKTVKEIKVTGEAEICLSNGRIKRRFYVNDGVVRLKMRGKQFKVTATGRSILKDIEMTAEVMDVI